MMADNKSFESTLHDIVYSIDTGTGLKIIRVGLYILILLMIVMVYTATQFRGLKSEEAMDYAQLGRNFSFQNGLVTKCVRPLSMWKMASRNPLENPQIGGHPDLYHPPAYPAVLASGFKLFELVGLDPFALPEAMGAVIMPAEQWVVLPVNNIFAMLTGWIVFSLGKRLFSREIGFVGMTVYYLSNIVWHDAISGLNISMSVFFIMASFLAMVVAMLNKRDKDSKASWLIPYLLSIVFAAVAFMTRYIAIAAVPGLCMFAWLMSGRFRGGTRFVFIFILLYLIIVSPWLIRNYHICGNPLGMVGYSALVESPRYPENSLDRELHPKFTLTSSVDTLKQKWVLNYSGKHTSGSAAMGGGILMAFFLVTFFYQFIRPQVNYLRWGVAISLLLTLVLAGFFSESSISMVHAYWPFAILYGLSFFYVLIDRLDIGIQLYTTGLKVLIVLVSAFPFILTLMPPHENHPYPPYYTPAISKVSSLLNPREVLCTDMPWATAWYGDRVSILLPKNLDQFYEINDLKQYISGIYITTITKNKPFIKDLVEGSEKSWFPIITGRTPPDFPLKHVTSLLVQDQIFLTDRNRWAMGGTQGSATRP